MISYLLISCNDGDVEYYKNRTPLIENSSVRIKKGKNMNTKLVNIILGNILYAIAVAFFIEPNGLITGGSTGIALFLKEMINLPITVFIGLFNCLTFLLGLWILGKKFALSTLISTFFFPFALGVCQVIYQFVGPLTNDKLLAIIFAGLLIGTGLAFVIQAGASTGGMDIPPLILEKKKGISIAKSMRSFDIIILFLQMIIATKEGILYGLLLVLLYTQVLDFVSIYRKKMIQFIIVSDKYEELNQNILQKMDRGTTLFNSQGGFSKQEVSAIFCVVAKEEVFAIKEMIMEIDPVAFVIMNEVGEVKGRGFSLIKQHNT